MRSGVFKSKREDSEFPVLCETCMGPSPYVRMMRDTYGKPCKVCDRPFTSFRWKPGPKARYKTTVICKSCARLKNVCQTCILDLQYNLPVQVRDSLLSEQSDALTVPESRVNREYYLNQMESKLSAGEMPAYAAQNESLLRMARRGPRYERNLPKLCSFFARGECTRGEGCPFRHEMPREKDDPLRKQNIRDRYHGNNDPVAAKILAHHAKRAPAALSKPTDESVKTLWVGGLTNIIREEDIKDSFYGFGEVKRVKMMERQRCAFVEYTTRAGAEAAAEALAGKLSIKGAKLHLTWAAKKKRGAAVKTHAGDISAGATAGGSATQMPAAPGSAGAKFALPSGIAGAGAPAATGAGAATAAAAGGAGGKPFYPSMDPSVFGARVKET